MTLNYHIWPLENINHLSICICNSTSSRIQRNHSLNYFVLSTQMKWKFEWIIQIITSIGGFLCFNLVFSLVQTCWKKKIFLRTWLISWFINSSELQLLRSTFSVPWFFKNKHSWSCSCQSRNSKSCDHIFFPSYHSFKRPTAVRHGKISKHVKDKSTKLWRIKREMKKII